MKCPPCSCLAVLGLAMMSLAGVAAPLAPLSPGPLKDKTLVAWASPDNPTQRGGSVLTLEKAGGSFDAIVFGELAPSTWMAGSDGFRRTKQEQLVW